MTDLPEYTYFYRRRSPYFDLHGYRLRSFFIFHVSGIDLVLGKDGVWYILEDNLRVPSGASYPTIARNP